MSIIKNEDDLRKGAEYLSRICPFMKKIVNICGIPPLRLQEHGFGGLVSTIISQQLSTASANTISERVKASFSPITPKILLSADEDILRKCGLSSPKIRTLRAVSSSILSGDLPFDRLGEIPEDMAKEALTSISGIGPWTAEIYLMFCLGVQDIFAPADLGLQEGTKLVMNLENRPSTREMQKISERWQPWRSVAARLLWKYYDLNKKVATPKKK